MNEQWVVHWRREGESPHIVATVRTEQEENARLLDLARRFKAEHRSGRIRIGSTRADYFVERERA